jgi:very-short-patch-repair endonuclease
MTGFVIVDGEIHDQKETAERDFERQDFLESLGFKVLRFKNNEVINDLEKVLRKVKGFLELI